MYEFGSVSINLFDHNYKIKLFFFFSAQSVVEPTMVSYIYLFSDVSIFELKIESYKGFLKYTFIYCSLHYILFHLLIQIFRQKCLLWTKVNQL